MPQPLRWDQTLPTGEPLRWDTPGATWGGTVEAVLAAKGNTMSKEYQINVTLTEAVANSHLAKHTEADALIPWLATMTPGGKGKLNSIARERAGMIAVFLQEMAAHPEFLPPYVDPAHAPAKAALYTQVKRLLDRNEDEQKRLHEALQRIGDDLMSDFSDYYGGAQAAAKRKLPDAPTTVANLKPYMVKAPKNKPASGGTGTPPPA